MESFKLGVSGNKSHKVGSRHRVPGEGRAGGTGGAGGRGDRRRLARISRRVACLLAALGLASQASALPTPLNVAGSPTYDSTTGNGFASAYILVVPGSGVNNSGTAVGYSEKYVSGVNKGHRAVRWDGSGIAATELGNLGTDSGGTTYGVAFAVNDAGTAVGYS